MINRVAIVFHDKEVVSAGVVVDAGSSSSIQSLLMSTAGMAAELDPYYDNGDPCLLAAKLMVAIGGELHTELVRGPELSKRAACNHESGHDESVTAELIPKWRYNGVREYASVWVVDVKDRFQWEARYYKLGCTPEGLDITVSKGEEASDVSTKPKCCDFCGKPASPSTITPLGQSLCACEDCRKRAIADEQATMVRGFVWFLVGFLVLSGIFAGLAYIAARTTS
jgi:hypothetical protein